MIALSDSQPRNPCQFLESLSFWPYDSWFDFTDSAHLRWYVNSCGSEPGCWKFFSASSRLCGEAAVILLSLLRCFKPTVKLFCRKQNIYYVIQSETKFILFVYYTYKHLYTHHVLYPKNKVFRNPRNYFDIHLLEHFLNLKDVLFHFHLLDLFSSSFSKVQRTQESNTF